MKSCTKAENILVLYVPNILFQVPKESEKEKKTVQRLLNDQHAGPSGDIAWKPAEGFENFVGEVSDQEKMSPFYWEKCKNQKATDLPHSMDPSAFHQLEL